MSSPQEVQEQADAFGWFHSIDLGGGVVTKASRSARSPTISFPPSPDAACWISGLDGYYSFMAERAGASRVVALDHYAWGVDIEARGAYWNECAANGKLPITP